MIANRCPHCGESLPGTANYCSHCGESLTSPEHQSIHSSSKEDQPNAGATNAGHTTPLRAPHLSEHAVLYSRESMDTKPMELAEAEETQHLSPSLATPVAGQQLFSDIDSDLQLLTIDEQDEDIDSLVLSNSASWNKVIHSGSTRQTPVSLPTRSLKNLSLGQATAADKRKRRPPALYFWLALLVIVCLLSGGLFGIFVIRGGKASHGKPLLQISPTRAVAGETITLSGSNFSPGGRVGLAYNMSNALYDTHHRHIIVADRQGSFTDTVQVPPRWPTGSYVISAEDALVHQIARFTLLVTNSPNVLIGPAHFLLLRNGITLSPGDNTLDLGLGDQATNSTSAITLTNDGGGQISWQASSTAPSWLLVSPPSGMLSSGQDQDVTIAVDRANLLPGPYQAEVYFTPNGGNPQALLVTMQVTKLQPGHEAVLQVSPAVLSFSATDGSSGSPGQVITVSNPGVQTLQWSAAPSTTDGSNWLSITPQSGTVDSGRSQAMKVNVNTSTLLPGVYSGAVTFNNAGPTAIQGSVQQVLISLTILPQCALQVSPGNLTFTDAYLQPAPAPKTLTVGASQSCSAPLSWNAAITTANNGQWLSMNTTSGTTPATMTLTASTTALTPGTYTATVIFTTSSGTQTVPVTLIIGQPTTPVLSASPDMVNFNGTTGQPNPLTQTATITNSGGGTLNWSATASTTVGGLWLTVSPQTGPLAAGASASITITARVLPSLTPGTYTGTVTVTGTDGAENPAQGSPQAFPVTFVVQAPCGISAGPAALAFSGVVGQSNLQAQTATITASGACAHALNWIATASASAPWLTATPASGTVSPSTPSTSSIGVVLDGLKAGTYTGTLTLAATDSVKNQPVGTPQAIQVTLVVQPPCTLQAPSVQRETFTTETGVNPNSRSFTIGITGTCSAAVTITPTATTGDGSGWLTVTPSSAIVESGGSATFTIAATPGSLPAGTYKGSISMAAVDSGITIVGSSQAIPVMLKVLAPPVLTASPSSLAFNVTRGTSSQVITIGNSGGVGLNWTAALAPNAPSFVSLSASSGTNLLGGQNASVRVTVNAAGLPAGKTYTTRVIIKAIDRFTNGVVVGSPIKIPITITVAGAVPAMQPGDTTLLFKIKAGAAPSAQALTISNSGGGTLTWTVSTPTVAWLTVTPLSGSDDAGASSPITFTVNVSGLSKGTYRTQVKITPGSGTAATIAVSVKVH